MKSSHDTVIYTPGKLLQASVIYQTGKNDELDSSLYLLNYYNQITLAGSKDTLRGNDYQQLTYHEFIYTSKNVTRYNFMEYAKYPFRTSTNQFNFGLGYGSNLNPLYKICQENPLLMIHFVMTDPLLTSSENNISSGTYSRGTQSATFNATTVLLPGSNYAQSQELKDEKGQLTGAYAYTYIIKLPK